MRALRPITIADGAMLAAIVAESLHEIEPGLRLIERHFVAGDATVDFLAVDGRGGLVAVVVETGNDASGVLRAFEATAWCGEHAALLSRAFAPAGADLGAPVRSILVTTSLDERARRLLRALATQAPAAVECRVFELGGEHCVAYERVASPLSSAPAAVPAVAGEPAPDARPGADPAAAERAQRLISRLEALRFRQAFQP